MQGTYFDASGKNSETVLLVGQSQEQGFLIKRVTVWMELATYVEAGSSSGYFVHVTRRNDRLKK